MTNYESTENLPPIKTPQQEIRQHFGQMLFTQRQKITQDITRSEIFKNLLAGNSGTGNANKTFGDPKNDADFYEKGALTTYPGGNFTFHFETPAIINSAYARSGMTLDDDFSMAGIDLIHTAKTTDLEIKLGIDVGPKGVDSIAVDSFMDSGIEDYLKEIDDDGELLTAIETHYYITQEGEIKKAISLPLAQFEYGEYYRLMETKLLKSGLSLIKIPQDRNEIEKSNYFTVSDVLVEDYELLGITLNMAGRRVQDAFQQVT